MPQISFIKLVRRLAVCLLTGTLGVGAAWLFALSQLPRAASAATATLSPTPSWVADGETPGMLFGSSVASAGDVNHDGYADVIIGAAGYLSYTGRAFVYLGSPTGLSPTPAFTFTGASIDAWLGIAVSGAGDVNGDGYSDVLIGEASQYSCAAHESRVYVFYGSAAGLNATPSLTLTEPTACNAFGASLASAGDVNGDGYADVVIGAQTYLSATGRIDVYLGSPTGLIPTPAFTATGEAIKNWYSFAVSSVGDANGDGYSDIVATAITYDNYQGRAYVYLGSATGLNPIPELTVTGESNSQLGIDASSAGDVNKDGYADFLISTSNMVAGTRLYLGGASLSAVPAITITDGYFSVSAAGDVNGDGYADIMASAPGVPYTGTVRVYAGSATGLQPTPIFTATGESLLDYYGAALSTAGDVNGDHVDDLLIAAYDYNLMAGRVYAYYGVADAPVYTPPQATADVYTLSEDSLLTVFTVTGALANDTATNLDLLTAVSATLPTTGTLALQANGAFTYTPPLNFNGLVTFTYRAFDQAAYSPPAVVTLTVTPVNDAPTISTMADQVIFFNTSTLPLPFIIGDVDNPPSTLTVTVASDNPTLIANSGLALDGSGSARTITLTPAPNQTGAATITLTVTDGVIPVSTSFQLTVTALHLYLPFILH